MVYHIYVYFTSEEVLITELLVGNYSPVVFNEMLVYVCNKLCFKYRYFTLQVWLLSYTKHCLGVVGGDLFVELFTFQRLLILCDVNVLLL